MARRGNGRIKYAWTSDVGRMVNKKNLPSASQAHSEIERIRMKYGDIKPDFIVDEARNPNNPLHNAFQWDEGKAARQHWLTTARLIIRSIKVIHIEGPEHNAYYQVRSKKARFYVPASEVQKNEDYAIQLLQEAERYYTSGRVRYDQIEALTDVHLAIDKTFKKAPKRKRKAA